MLFSGIDATTLANDGVDNKFIDHEDHIKKVEKEVKVVNMARSLASPCFGGPPGQNVGNLQTRCGIIKILLIIFS